MTKKNNVVFLLFYSISIMCIYAAEDNNKAKPFIAPTLEDVLIVKIAPLLIDEQSNMDKHLADLNALNSHVISKIFTREDDMGATILHFITEPEALNKIITLFHKKMFSEEDIAHLLNQEDKEGLTPLHYLALDGSLNDPKNQAQVEELVRIMTQNGALIDNRDHNDFTPFMWAVKNHLFNTANIFLEYGANPTLNIVRRPDEYRMISTPFITQLLLDANVEGMGYLLHTTRATLNQTTTYGLFLEPATAIIPSLRAEGWFDGDPERYNIHPPADNRLFLVDEDKKNTPRNCRSTYRK